MWRLRNAEQRGDDHDPPVRRAQRLLDLDTPFHPGRVDILEVLANTGVAGVWARLELVVSVRLRTRASGWRATYDRALLAIMRACRD